MDLESNPYDPPLAPIAQFGPRDDFPALEIAGKGRRFGTFVIDYIVSVICVMGFDIVLGVFLGEDGLEGLGGLLLLFNILASLAYYIVFEGLIARTPGKLICGTKVVDQYGGPASFGQILGRTACRCIPFEPFSFLGDRGWHDSISKTSVVLA